MVAAQAPDPVPPLPGVRNLIAVRCLRSLTQGALNVAAPLYLLGHGVSPTGLGVLFTASFVVGAVLTAPIGIGADRWGRKPFLLAFTVLMLAWGLIYSVTTFVPALLVISAVAGIGRGGGGMGAGQAGPFGPAEQAWLADVVPAGLRAKVFSRNGVLAALAAAVGSLLAGVPDLVGSGWFGTDQPLFVLTGVLAVVSLVLLWSVPDPVAQRPAEPVRDRRRGRAPLSAASFRLVLRQAAAGGANAFGVAFINSLFVVWLHLRFGATASSIGPVFTISYLLSAASIVGAGALARRAGSVRTIVAARVAAAGLMLATGLAPSFAVAIAAQVLRTAATMMIVPVRQSFTMGLFPTRERASAAGVTGVVRRLAGAASPPITGAMFDTGMLEVPFFLGAGFQLVSAVLYRVFFLRYEPARPPALDEADVLADDAEP